MVFAAGLGTRLRPLTDNIPKALVSVDGTPMLGHILLNLKDAGFDEIVINIHHFGQMIIDYLSENKNFGLTIHISDERNFLLDTGGGILQARQWLDGSEPFLVHNADIISDLNLQAFYDFHCRSHADASLLVAERITKRYLLFGNDNRLEGWINKETGETRPPKLCYHPALYKERAFGGIHVLSPTVFPELEKYGQTEKKFSITPFYTTTCQTLDIRGYEPKTTYHWFDIGKPETLVQVETWMESQHKNEH